ncbi:MAG: MGMT family protein [Chloroflexota bacterium]
MNQPATTRDLVAALRHLGAVSAPDGLLDAALGQIWSGDSLAPVQTTIGTVYVAFHAEGVFAVARGHSPQSVARSLSATYGRLIRPVDAAPAHVAQALGNGDASSIQVDLRGRTPFEQAVLRKAREIPRGEVRPYNWIAREIGHPAAVRAVGTALRKNPVPLLVPCHRVVRGDTTMGNYALGADLKLQILEREGVPVAELRNLAHRGIRFLASGAETFCLPTCQRARAAGHIELHNKREALARGLHPCPRCRPAVAV